MCLRGDQIPRAQLQPALHGRLSCVETASTLNICPKPEIDIAFVRSFHGRNRTTLKYFVLPWRNEAPSLWFAVPLHRGSQAAVLSILVHPFVA